MSKNTRTEQELKHDCKVYGFGADFLIVQFPYVFELTRHGIPMSFVKFRTVNQKMNVRLKKRITSKTFRNKKNIRLSECNQLSLQ